MWEKLFFKDKKIIDILAYKKQIKFFFWWKLGSISVRVFQPADLCQVFIS